MTSIDVAREMLSRTKVIGACIDALAEPHRRVIELRDELSKEPFAELDHTKGVLSAELRSIEALLGQGMADEAWSAVAVYEGRVRLMLPGLRQLAGIRRGMRAMGAGVLPPELTNIERRLLGNDLAGAEEALRSFGPGGSASESLPDATPSPEAGGRPCTLCGRKVRDGLDLCPFCGWEVGAPSAECPECGSTVLRSFRACPSCGKGLPQSAHEGKDVQLITG